MRERMAGFALMCVVVPLAVVGYLLLVWIGIFGPNPWRVRATKPWARAVIRVTDRFQPDHCRRANKREQPVVNLILAAPLDKQTIF